MRGILHRYRDMIYEKGTKIAIPILIKMRLTPNQITVLRFLVLIPPSAFLFTLNNYYANIAALTFYHLFVFLDVLDGKIAVIRGMCTRLGEMIDPPIDYIGHNLVFVGIIIGVLGSNGTFRIGFYSISIPVQFLLICGILTIVGLSVPIIFCIRPPTRFFMIKDLHDLHKDFFIENKTKSDHEPLKVWMCKNIVCPHNFPFNILFKIGTLLTICALLNVLFASLIIFAISLNIRTLALFWYFFKIYKTQKFSLSK